MSAASKIISWQRNPLLFAREGLRFPELTGQQEDLLRALGDRCANQDAGVLAAVKGAPGTGKTTVQGVIALWRLFLASYTHVIVTAPTHWQLKEDWVPSLHSILGRADPIVRKAITPGPSGATFLTERSSCWGIRIRSGARADNFQGWMSPRMTFIVDEASGVPDDVIRLLTTVYPKQRGTLVLLMGSPMRVEGEFYERFVGRNDEGCLLGTWDAASSPLPDHKSLHGLKNSFGAESDVYRVRALGKFPLQGAV